MTPMMHERVRNMFGDAGLTTGFTVQQLMYDDPGDQSKAIMVFRPNGGSNIRTDLGSEYHVLVDVVGAKISAETRSMQCSVSSIMSRLTQWLTNASATSRTWAQFPRRCSQKKGE